jgi:hypothetical protein
MQSILLDGAAAAKDNLPLRWQYPAKNPDDAQHQEKRLAQMINLGVGQGWRED